jgi:hypothetical protein
MQIRVNFFDKPAGQGAQRILVSYPTGDFTNLKEAREIAFADADKPTILAQSVIIESVDDPSLSEHWTRDKDRWKIVDDA